ncbi:MAG: DUF5685 family protein [Lachnospiraceae bacterium]|nr:DUF5685 family protein [Lachnospiraceae bacterium]
MFGYVRVRKPELKIKDYEVYRGFYCGLCGCLKERYGLKGRVTLTYDATFLTMFLSSLHGLKAKKRKCRCVVHPAVKHTELITEASLYAADMNILLSWYHLLDDVQDDGSKKAAAASRLFHKAFLELEKRYPLQSAGIAREMRRLSAAEKNAASLMEAASCFGRLMIWLFRWKPYPLQHEVDGLAFHLGRFIYICDAWEDREEDEKKGRFNPLEGDAEAVLLDEIARACWYFEKLPCPDHLDILRNILYAGVWNRYDRKRSLEAKKRNDARSENA